MRNISKAYPGVQALNDVTLEAEGGQVLGLVGINGAGKSTLMNVLGGVTSPDAGEIIIEGESVVFSEPRDAEEKNIAFIHQEPQFFLSLTVAENIFISNPFTLDKLPFVVDRKRASAESRRYLDMLGATIDPTAKMEEISIGERQLVEIARAIAHESKIIILDEPTSSLSFHEKEKLFRIIEVLKDKGIVIIYISHFLDEILEICDTFLVLRDGTVSGRGLVRDASKNDFIKMITGSDIDKDIFESRRVQEDPVLEVQHLRSGALLRDITFHLNKGEVLGVWGLMGSGRTELLRAMFGLDKVDGGTVAVVRNGTKKTCRRKQLLRFCGYITENRHDDGLFLPLPVWMNLSCTKLWKYATRLVRFLKVKLEKEEAEQHKGSLKIKVKDTDTLVRQLSGGNQQKVVLAKWIYSNRSILVMDEPTRGVDVGAKSEIHHLIRQEAQKGVSILLVSSELEEIVNLCDRAVVLRDGVIQEEVGLEEMTSERLLTIAMGAGE